jgi:hypothetical protein
LLRKTTVDGVAETMTYGPRLGRVTKEESAQSRGEPAGSMLSKSIAQSAKGFENVTVSFVFDGLCTI